MPSIATTLVGRVCQQALNKGACDRIKDVQSLSQLLELAFTPQGVEFCQKNAFPSSSLIQQLAQIGTNRPDRKCMCIIVRNKPLEIWLSEETIVSGEKTKVYARAKYKQYINRILLFHGASLVLNVDPWVVVHITQIGAKGTIDIRSKGEQADIIID